MGCPFCDPAPERIVAENALALALRDGFPVSPGHTLAVPRRHVASWFDATDAERAALLALLDAVRDALLRTERPPDGFNLGVNAGEAAGQTVPHLHVHLQVRRPAGPHGPVPGEERPGRVRPRLAHHPGTGGEGGGALLAPDRGLP